MGAIGWIERHMRSHALRSGTKAFEVLDQHWQQIVIDDLARTSRYKADDVIGSLEDELIKSRAFRSIMLYRIKSSGNSEASNLFRRFRQVYPESPGIEIEGDIEGGLQIVHNCCVLRVEHAGRNLSIGPFVVVGKGAGRRSPTIGNDVKICANSTVINGIRIGDHALIGAGSLIRHDVEANTVVGGNPPKVIRKRG